MSGKRAAAALLQFDADLAREVEELNVKGVMAWEDSVAFARRAYSLWTVSLAASAAGVSEETTIAALLYNHMRCGTPIICQAASRAAAQGPETR